MKYRRTVYIMIIAAVLCVSFSAGFLIGRRTAGGTYTITAEKSTLGREGIKYDTVTGETSREVLGTKNTDGNIEIEDLYVNINTCTQDQLILLPSIGETRASCIIEYRKKNGPFRNIADIMQVNGIGESIYDKIKQFIYVDIYNTAGE